jgi:hypothetical protein
MVNEEGEESRKNAFFFYNDDANLITEYWVLMSREFVSSGIDLFSEPMAHNSELLT